MTPKTYDCDHCKNRFTEIGLAHHKKEIKEKEYIKSKDELLNAIRKHKQLDILYVDSVLITDSANNLIVVHLFKCPICGRLIEVEQLNFARNCGPCDVGDRSRAAYIVKTYGERIQEREKERTGGRSEN